MLSGIYRILNLANGKCYIGSSQDVDTRWKAHINLLKGDRHHSKKLQHAWNKYGEGSFSLVILELASPLDLPSREQAWLDSTAPSYNILKFAWTVRGLKHTAEAKMKMSLAKTGVKQSEEVIRKRTEGLKGRKLTPEHIANLTGKVVSEGTRRKLSAANTGKIRSEETRIKCGQNRRGKKFTAEGKANLERAKANMTEAQKQNVINITIKTHSKSYIVISPEGVSCKVFNLSEFCRRKELGNGSGLGRVATGARKQYKGWRCIFDSEEKVA